MTPVERCRRLGWEARDLPSARAQVDVLQVHSFGFARAWATASDWTLTDSPGQVHAILTLEGAITYRLDDGTEVTASPGSVVLFDSGSRVNAVTHEESARFMWRFTPKVLTHEPVLLRTEEPLPFPDQPMGSLISATNSLLNAGTQLDGYAAKYVALSLEYLLGAALLSTSVETQSARRMSPDDIVSGAQRLIEQNFRSQSLAVSSLARELGVSESRLHAVYATRGTSPRREIEKRRVAEVKRLLPDWDRDLTVVARRAGFSSARHLQRALRRTADG